MTFVKLRFKSGSCNWLKNGVQTKKLIFTHFLHQWSMIMRDWWFHFTVYWYKIQCWLWNREKNLVKIPESLLNQKVKRNYQLEVQDYFQAQVQFREKDNLPTWQSDFQTLGFDQVSIEIESWFSSTEGMWIGEMIDSV